MNQVHVILASTLMWIAGVHGDCWETGCQLDSWAVVGCAQYGRIEKSRKSCNDPAPGNKYMCCTNPAGGCAKSTNSLNEADITFSQFETAVKSNGYPAPTCAQFESFIVGLPKGGITEKQEAAMALANFLQESAGLTAKREFACEKTGCPGSYETPGCDAPGQDYYGRGYIQLSWCYNYKPASQYLFNDDRLVRDPDQVARNEQTSWDTAFWFWLINVHNAEGVQQGKFGATVNAINGALECRGAHQDLARKRYAMYVKVRAAFGLVGAGDERGCYN